MGLITVTGGLAFDYIMSFSGNFTDYLLPEQLQSLSLSFTVDAMSREQGGTAGNIAHNLALLQQPVLLMAAMGQDGGGLCREPETNGGRYRRGTHLTPRNDVFFFRRDRPGR